MGRAAIADLVKTCLTAKRRDAGADAGLRSEATSSQVSALEWEIDELVYALYGLTKDEIKIVEESALR